MRTWDKEENKGESNEQHGGVEHESAADIGNIRPDQNRREEGNNDVGRPVPHGCKTNGLAPHSDRKDLRRNDPASHGSPSGSVVGNEEEDEDYKKLPTEREGNNTDEE